jgi:hypothetical protein
MFFVTKDLFKKDDVFKTNYFLQDLNLLIIKNLLLIYSCGNYLDEVLGLAFVFKWFLFLEKHFSKGIA